MKSIDKKITAQRVITAAAEAEHGQFKPDADRRLVIGRMPELPTTSLRWEKRPQLVGGNPSHVYEVPAPEGKFALQVGHIVEEDGVASPFEVWAIGEEAPRGLSALARSLSIDMRSRDRAWLKRKLLALKKTPGIGFQLAMPDGSVRNVRGAVEAFALLIEHRCTELGAFDLEHLSHTPVINAMMSKREPKTMGAGATCWYADVENPATGDEFTLVLKEGDVEGGGRRPFSVWFAGDYPRSLDGLAKSLSLDMRIAEPGWVARKLRQLVGVHEKHGDFWASVPGRADNKQVSYPSTVAYVAELLLGRYKTLGILADDGSPVIDSGAVGEGQNGDLAASADKLTGAGFQGLDCEACGGVATVILMDGCMTCRSCASSKCG